MDYVRDGVRIAYDLRGEGEPVVLVCGAGMPALMWDFTAVPSLLEAGYRVLTFDNRGVAPSDAPDGPYAVDDMVADVVGLLDHVELGPARMMGYSAGGWLVEEVARRRPDLVRCGSMIAGVGRSSAWEKASLQALKRMLEAGESVPSDYDAAMSLPTLLAPANVQDDAMFATWYALLSGAGAAMNYGQICAWTEWSSSDDKQLGEISRPMQVIAYEFDIQCAPQHAKAASDEIGDCEFVLIEGAGHLGGMEKTDETNGAVLDFFARH